MTEVKINTSRIGPPGQELCRATARCELFADSDEHESMMKAVQEAKDRLLAAEKAAFAAAPPHITANGMGIVQTKGKAVSDRFFAALDKAGVVDASLKRAAELQRMLDLREAQLADCTRAMLKVATLIRDAINSADEDGQVDVENTGTRRHQIDVFEDCAAHLETVRATK